MLSDQQEQNLKAAAPAALRTEEATGMPARVTLAQWVEESGWGTHAPGCNCFGIKSYTGCYGTQILMTREGNNLKQIPQTFATFPSSEACFTYHARLITTGQRYGRAWMGYAASRNSEQLIRDIAPIYAPGNDKYATNVLGHFRDQRIIDALQNASTTPNA